MAPIHLLKVSRLEGLTDGIFAIAMTIIVLNLHVPIHLSDGKITLLIQDQIYTNLVIYIGTFIILGTHWIAMNFQWGLLERLNRTYLWVNMFYLMAICVIPFSANFLGEYRYSMHSINFYIINLLCASAGQFLALHCAEYYKLFKHAYTPAMYRAAVLRMLVAPLFYFSALMLAHWSIRGAFVLLVLPTLIYMIPGRIDRYEGINQS